MPPEDGANSHVNKEAARECGCAVGKLRAVHDYLKGCFPGQTLRDVHRHGTSAPARASAPATDYHIVQIGDLTRPYSVVLTTEFLDHPLDELPHRLDQMQVLAALQTYRLVIVWGNGAYPLRTSGPEHG